MRKYIYSIAILMISASIAIVSCSKDDEKSASEILTSGKWYQESRETTSIVAFGGEADTTVDKLQDCEKDDYMEFKSDGTYKETKGTVKCDDESSAETGKWTLTNGDKTFTITDNVDKMPLPYTIESISDSKITLKIDYSSTLSDGNMKFTGTLVVVKK